LVSKVYILKLVAWKMCFQIPFYFSGHDEENIRMEIVELDDHPYFVATQYHPEYLSRPLKPSPPFFGLILASVGKLHSYVARGCRLTPKQLSDVESGNHKETDNRKKTCS
jgi:CTP synthase